LHQQPPRGAQTNLLNAETWLKANRRQIASLLTEEKDPALLSDQEVEESTGKYFSYYDQDVVVIDWDAALIVDEPRFFEDRSTSSNWGICNLRNWSLRPDSRRGRRTRLPRFAGTPIRQMARLGRAATTPRNPHRPGAAQR